MHACVGLINPLSSVRYTVSPLIRIRVNLAGTNAYIATSIWAPDSK